MFRNTPILPSHTALCIFFPFYPFQTCGSHPDLRPTTINSKYYHFCHYVALVCTSTNHSSIWPLAWHVFFWVDGVLAGLIQQSSQRGTVFPFISLSTGTEEDLGDLRSPCTLCMTNQSLQLSPARFSGACTQIVFWWHSCWWRVDVADYLPPKPLHHPLPTPTRETSRRNTIKSRGDRERQSAPAVQQHQTNLSTKSH